MRQGGHRILCEMISQLQVISAQVIKTKNNQDTFDSATALHAISIHSLLSRAAARELVKLNRCAGVHHSTGIRMSKTGRGFS
jgi:hypothetical protein